MLDASAIEWLVCMFPEYEPFLHATLLICSFCPFKQRSMFEIQLFTSAGAALIFTKVRYQPSPKLSNKIVATRYFLNERQKMIDLRPVE